MKNSGEEVVLGAGKLTYTHKNIGKTYRYTMEEVSDATQKSISVLSDGLYGTL